MKNLVSAGRVAGGVAGLAVLALLAARGDASDHADAPILATNPLADITDVYAWMTVGKLNLVMNVSPRDDGTRSFGPSVQYVFHVTSKAALGAGGTERKVIVRFASNTRVEAWVTDGSATHDYLVGDPSLVSGVQSASKKLRVFAGRRSDPFFFNMAGFADAITAINMIPASPPPDAAGCPTGLPAGQALAIRNLLARGTDAFAAANVMSIVVELDPGLVVRGTDTLVAVWGASHAGT